MNRQNTSDFQSPSPKIPPVTIKLGGGFSFTGCCSVFGAMISRGLAGVFRGSSCHATRAWRPLVLTVLALALVAVLRYGNLDAFSVWTDETCGLQAALGSAKNIAEAFHIHALTLQMMHGYYMLQYLWAQWVGDTIHSLRVMSASFQVGAAVLLLLLGRRLVGFYPTLLAMVFFALSPFQQMCSTQLRPYPLISMLGMISLYTFVRMLENRGRGYWIVNVLANIHLVWTHLTGGCLFAVEGFYLIVIRREFRRAAWWTLAHLPFIMLAMYLMLPMNNPHRHSGGDPITALFLGLFGSDFYVEFIARSTTPVAEYCDLSSLEQFLLGHVTPVVCLWAVFLVAGFIAFLWRFFRFCEEPLPASSGYLPVRERLGIMLLWAIGTPMVLFVFSLTVTSLSNSRYFTYSCIGMYAILASVICSIRRPWIRATLVALSVASMTFLCAASWNTIHWDKGIGILSYVDAHTKPGENVYIAPADPISEMGPNYDAAWEQAAYRSTYMMMHNQGRVRFKPTPNEFHFSFDYEFPFLIKQVSYADAYKAIEMAAAEGRATWIITRHFGDDLLGDCWRFEDVLTGRHVAFERKIFCCFSSGAFLYHCRPGPGYTPFESQEALELFAAAQKDR